METQTTSKARLWVGRVISILAILFLLMDGGMKAIKAAPAIEGSTQLDWPAEYVQGIGIVLLLCTVLYAIPRTIVLGAILLTGYLGGAVAIMTRVEVSWWFPVVMGVMTWVGLVLRNDKVREVLLGK